MTADLENVCREKLAKVGDPESCDRLHGRRLARDGSGHRLAQQTSKFLDTYFGDVPDKASKGASARRPDDVFEADRRCRLNYTGQTGGR